MTIETYCDELAQEGRIIFCKKRRAADPDHRLVGAPCMIDPCAAAYIDTQYCEGFKPRK